MTRNRPCLVGLTGGIACGKSNLSAALRRHGAVVIDADEISRSLTAPGGLALSAIRGHFGDAVFDDGILNRRKLSDAVFNRPDELAALNGIMHPLVFQEMDRQIAQNQSQTALMCPCCMKPGMRLSAGKSGAPGHHCRHRQRDCCSAD